VIILTFHGVGTPSRAVDESEGRVWLSTERFEQVLDQVRGRPHVKITFDDGNLSDVELALPALLKRHLHAEFFIVTRRIGQQGFIDDTGLRELLQCGMSIGSHGMHHRAWHGLSDRALQEEITGAREILENHIGRAVTTAACPFGAYDRSSLRALREAGFEYVLTSDRQPSEPGDWLQSRYTIHASDTAAELQAILSGSRRRPKWLHTLRCTLKQLAVSAR
jgi:peptidoglycan/xylan/chitin deacetylase (PgdA/CDA1 family)